MSTFYGCTSLASVIIPDSVTSIVQQAFYKCTSLTSIIFEGNSAPNLQTYSFCLGDSSNPVTATVYTKGGWGSDSVFNTSVRGGSTNANYTTFIYKELIYYTVSYNGNGGDTPPAQNAVSGTAIILPFASRAQYTLNGWYTAASGGTKVGDAGTSYTVTANITLYAQWRSYAFSAKYDRISADQILDNIGKTIETVQNKLHEYITSLGGVTYTNSSGVFSYSLPDVSQATTATVTLPGAEVASANNKEHASAGQPWRVVYTLPAESYASYHSMNNIITSLNALKTHYNSMKHAKVTQVSMSAMFMALASLLSSLTYHRARFVDRTILRSNVQTTAVAGGSVTPTVSVANITNWGNNINAIAHATAEQSTEVFDISVNGTAAFTSSSCSSSSSSSCCSSSCSSSSCSSSCSCFFVVFYNLGGL